MTSKNKRNNKTLPVFNEGAILAVNKPKDWTSFDVVNKIRRLTGIRKVGHAGTLDPFATGVLLVLVGPATKQASSLMDLSKEYIANISLGQQTDTLDITGKVIEVLPVPELSTSKVNSVLQSFLGVIEQEVPSFSAVKHKGKRLYKLARKGKDVPKIFKKVHIKDIELLQINSNSITIRVECGRGTYIRALARDIARKLGTVGYVSELVRTRIGDYHLEDCWSLEELQNQIVSGAVETK
ncbi:MAG: tRNA pseudouridine(55) synthase TruB [Calditrichaeota bacterium]|nr:MAG: tRNA pseudouridine(55) synthase TruB [Calditrichota bacterium]